MQTTTETDIIDALDSWEQHWSEAQDAAVLALKTAFPPLMQYPQFGVCEHPRLEYGDGELGGLDGRVCVDEGRANIEFNQVPNEVIRQAVDDIGFPYLDCADGPLSEAPSGTYTYECELTSSHFEFTLDEAKGKGKVCVWGATIPDAVEVLDAFHRAFDGRGSDGSGR